MNNDGNNLGSTNFGWDKDRVQKVRLGRNTRCTDASVSVIYLSLSVQKKASINPLSNTEWMVLSCRADNTVASSCIATIRPFAIHS